MTPQTALQNTFKFNLSLTMKYALEICSVITIIGVNCELKSTKMTLNHGMTSFHS